MYKLPVSLCTFVKNEEKNLVECIESVRAFVSEIVVVDTGSTDNTVKLAKSFTDRVYEIPFIDFGTIRTITAHLASHPWVLMLDADERLEHDPEKLFHLINQPTAIENFELDIDGNVVIDSWALPRKRWSDEWMTKQVDVESYPDWQIRLFRNHEIHSKIKFVRRVHEMAVGAVRTEHSIEGPIIHHVQNVNKDREDLLARKELYTRLYKLDLADGVEHSEPPIIGLDDV